MFEQVRLLAEGLGADVAAEGLLARVGAKVHLDVGLVEEPPVADAAPMHRLLLAEQAAQVAGTEAGWRNGAHLGRGGRTTAIALLLLLLLLVLLAGFLLGSRSLGFWRSSSQFRTRCAGGCGVWVVAEKIRRAEAIILEG